MKSRHGPPRSPKVEMDKRIENGLSLLVTLCAVLVSAAVLREHRSDRSVNSTEPTLVKRWDRLVNAGQRIGPSSAPVQIVEFGDFQCPYCRRFHAGLEQIIADLPGKVSLAYIHYPIPNHQFAEPAARAAECAATQGRFGEMVKAMFDKQDSLGVKSWWSYAASVGVADSTAFVKCTHSEAVDARLAADRELVTEFAVRATPTVIINGWRYQVPPPADSLKRIAKAIVAERNPFPKR